MNLTKKRGVTTMKSEKIEKGIFFPEDFKELPKGAIIYIKEGELIIAEE